MDDNDYPSDSEQSDEDYRPTDDVNDDSAADSEPGSHAEDNADDDDDDDNDGNVNQSKSTGKNNNKKRKKKENKRNGVKQLKTNDCKSLNTSTTKNDSDNDDENSDQKSEEMNSKNHADALWADFLKDTSDDSTKQEVVTTKSKDTATQNNKQNVVIATNNAKNTIEKKKITEIFEFAGEKVEVPVSSKIIDGKSKVNNESSSAQLNIKKNIPINVRRGGHFGMQRSGGGGGGSAIESILGALSKTKKINTFEKTQLDWNKFKDKEGISEDLQTHNKGRDGFLERKDFLQRTDLRQFEIEKDLRTCKKSNR